MTQQFLRGSHGSERNIDQSVETCLKLDIEIECLSFKYGWVLALNFKHDCTFACCVTCQIHSETIVVKIGKRLERQRHRLARLGDLLGQDIRTEAQHAWSGRLERAVEDNDLAMRKPEWNLSIELSRAVKAVDADELEEFGEIDLAETDRGFEIRMREIECKRAGGNLPSDKIRPQSLDAQGWFGVFLAWG